MAGARVRRFPGKRAKTGRRTCKWKNHPGLMTAGSPAVLGLPRCRRRGKRREGRSRRKQACFKSNAAWGAAVGTRSSSRPGWPRGRADLPRRQPPAPSQGFSWGCVSDAQPVLVLRGSCLLCPCHGCRAEGPKRVGGRSPGAGMQPQAAERREASAGRARSPA